MGPMSGDLLVFDGDCAFCQRCVGWARRWLGASAQLMPWQGLDLAALGLSRQECTQAVQWVGVNGARAAGPVAVGRLLLSGSWWWRPIGALLTTRPVGWLAWPVYRWVARHRHQLPGGTQACALPPRH